VLLTDGGRRREPNDQSYPDGESSDGCEGSKASSEDKDGERGSPDDPVDLTEGDGAACKRERASAEGQESALF
jgi:hypothetical protein